MLKAIAVHLRQSDRGQDIVEFALITPLLLLIVMGIIDFGLGFNDYLVITHAAREGSRYAAVGNSAADTTTQVLQTVAKGQTSATCQTSPSSYAQWPNVSVCVTIPAKQGETLQVTVNTRVPLINGYLASNVPGLSGFLVGNTFPLSSPAQMSFEGPKI